MRAIQFVNTLATSDGGPARNSYELNIALNRRDSNHVQLFWIKGEAENSVALSSEDHPLPPQQLLSRNSPLWEHLGRVVRELKTADMAIIHGYYLPWIPLIALASRALGTPFVITPHGSLTRHQRKYSVTRKWIFDHFPGLIVRRLSHGFVTGSPIEAEELSEHFPSVPVAVAGVGTRMPSKINEKNTWSSPLRLLSLSRIAPKKRIDLSIQAIAELKRLGIKAILNIAGSGTPALENRLKELAKVEGVKDQVHFLGECSGSDKTEAFLDADLFLLPSDDENFGIGVAEAAAHGVPVIASTGVAAARFIREDAGEVIDRPTGASLAQTISSFISEHDAAEAHRKARSLAEEVYSWDGAIKAWQRALSSLGLPVSTS